jgi:hypothetical protein
MGTPFTFEILNTLNKVAVNKFDCSFSLTNDYFGREAIVEVLQDVVGRLELIAEPILKE